MFFAIIEILIFSGTDLIYYSIVDFGGFGVDFKLAY